MTSYLKRDLHKFALTNNCDLARSIYNCPHMVIMELIAFHNIALHVAVKRNSSNFVEGLLSIMTQKTWRLWDGNNDSRPFSVMRLLVIQTSINIVS